MFVFDRLQDGTQKRETLLNNEVINDLKVEEISVWNEGHEKRSVQKLNKII